jgi:2'-5' RNA ligase
VRAFFAVDLSGEARSRLGEAAAEARNLLAGEPIRWVRTEILHLTLRFLGETEPDVLDRVRRGAEECGSTWRPFDLLVQGLGCFPDDRRPRVIWAGTADESGALVTIREDLERVARGAGFPPESRPFSAHLTLGRIKDRLSPDGGKRLAELVSRAASEVYGIVPVRTVELLKSDLRPTGPIYTRLATIVLTE